MDFGFKFIPSRWESVTKTPPLPLLPSIEAYEVSWNKGYRYHPYASQPKLPSCESLQGKWTLPKLPKQEHPFTSYTIKQELPEAATLSKKTIEQIPIKVIEPPKIHSWHIQQTSLQENTSPLEISGSIRKRSRKVRVTITIQAPLNKMRLEEYSFAINKFGGPEKTFLKAQECLNKRMEELRIAHSEKAV